MTEPRSPLLMALMASLLLLSIPGAALAQDGPPAYGLGLPASAGDLPPGLLRAGLEDLPPASRSRALDWLQDFDFPAADAATLRVDGQGGVFYEEPVAEATTDDGGDPPLGEALTQSEVFTLHSRPGASRVVYLDMDGHVVSGTAWNSGRADPLYMTAFDTDGNTGSFSTSELNVIADTWRRIAEDYAPYDIDVTTEEPPSFGPQVGHILVSPQTDAFGNKIYDASAGGVAYVNVWGGAASPTTSRRWSSPNSSATTSTTSPRLRPTSWATTSASPTMARRPSATTRATAAATSTGARSWALATTARSPSGARASTPTRTTCRTTSRSSMAS